MVRRAMPRSPWCRSTTCPRRLRDTRPSRGMRPVMSERAAYLRYSAAIYARSFAIIRAEADLARFSAEEADVVVRMIHACGQVEIAPHVLFGGNLVAAARGALAAGAPIFCDAEMVAHGITRARLPAGNAVICTLNDPGVAAFAAQNGTTRSAGAAGRGGAPPPRGPGGAG